jgi:hypothetical protein
MSGEKRGKSITISGPVVGQQHFVASLLVIAKMFLESGYQLGWSDAKAGREPRFKLKKKGGKR